MRGKTLQNYYYYNLIKSFSLVYLFICLKLSIDLILYPHTPFMVKQHLGILFIMLIYTKLGLFAGSAELLRFLLRVTCFRL